MRDAAAVGTCAPRAAIPTAASARTTRKFFYNSGTDLLLEDSTN